MKYIVDSSIWIDYFKGGKSSFELDDLIDNNIIAVNEIILTELIPALAVRKHNKVIKLLNSIHKLDLNIDWGDIVKMQTKCLASGYNGVGIPDLIIAQNAIQNKYSVWTLAKHYKVITDISKLRIK